MPEEEMPEEYELSDDYENSWESVFARAKRRSLISKKNNEIIADFLGEGPRSVEKYEPESYYWGLSAWTVKCIFASPGWKTVSILGYSRQQPFHRDIPTDYTKFATCLTDGQMLVENDDIRFVITIYCRPRDINFIQVEAKIEYQEQVKKLLQEITDFQMQNNFYRGKRLCLNNELSFVTTGQKDWDSVILDPMVKKEIRLNTIDFLKRRDKLEKCGIPSRRGIILAGEPGTGKTAICKALMWEGEGITRISTNAYGMMQEGYVCDVFSIAQELSPTIIIIEDLDFIGHERSESFRGTPGLIALLAEMDGIEEKKRSLL